MSFWGSGFAGVVRSLNSTLKGLLGHVSRVIKKRLSEFRGTSSNVRVAKRVEGSRCRANIAYIRQSRPDSGIGVQITSPETLPRCPRVARIRTGSEVHVAGRECGA